jgi:hypothetical protein
MVSKEKISNISPFSIFCGHEKFNQPIFSLFSFLVELLMSAKYTKWTNIWKFLTPLNCTHLEVFLRILWDFFIFELKFKFWIWTGWEPAGTGPDRYDRFPPVRLTMPSTHAAQLQCRATRRLLGPPVPAGLVPRAAAGMAPPRWPRVLPVAPRGPARTYALGSGGLDRLVPVPFSNLTTIV